MKEDFVGGGEVSTVFGLPGTSLQKAVDSGGIAAVQTSGGYHLLPRNALDAADAADVVNQKAGPSVLFLHKALDPQWLLSGVDACGQMGFANVQRAFRVCEA